MTTVTKRRRYLRSSENTGEAEAQATHEARRLAKLEAAEPRGFDWEDDCAERASLSFGMGSGAAASVLVRPLTIAEAFADAKLYDETGRVYG